MDQDLERERSFPDQSHWRDITINGYPIPEIQHDVIWYQYTDQGKADQTAKRGA